MERDSFRLPEPVHSLMGGLERKAVTNFYGAPGTGKTNLCMLASLECIKSGGSVVFIDTEGGFSLERLRQLSTQDVEEVLKKITISEPSNFREQGRAVKELENQQPDLVVLDSAVALYRLECAEQSGKRVLMPSASKELSRQLSVLSNLARRKGIPVIITAHTYSNWETGNSEVIGGDSLKYWSHALVFLEKTGKTSERKCTLIKHRSLAEGRQVGFVIIDRGIKPSGVKLF